MYSKIQLTINNESTKQTAIHNIVITDLKKFKNLLSKSTWIEHHVKNKLPKYMSKYIIMLKC